MSQIYLGQYVYYVSIAIIALPTLSAEKQPTSVDIQLGPICYIVQRETFISAQTRQMDAGALGGT